MLSYMMVISNQRLKGYNMIMANKKTDLNKNLSKLSEIADWFENQKDIDVEEGLKKVKEAANIVKESKGRLKEIDNEFEEIRADIEKDLEEQ